MEERIVTHESSLPFRGLPAAALRGRAPWTAARNLAIMLRGIVAARRLIDEVQPAAILGTGGYVCVPLLLAARQKRVPTLIYLPDIVPGMAVKFLSRVATRVACSFEASRRYFQADKVVITGYPVRPELFALDQQACRAEFSLNSDLPVLLVYGGSRGARSINRAVCALLPDLLQIAQILHVCGREGDEVWLREAAERLPEELQARYRLYPYLHGTMAQAFGAADLALCRSGASTLGELPAVGLGAVLVPYPYVHQDENADFLVHHGAAVKIDDEEMLGKGQPSEGPLFQELRRLLTDHDARQALAARSRALARPEAAEQLAAELLELGGYDP
ncbi:MAG: UDP-N-acetylglucosamine--N-acetylmuramyl-(pentapeptide) pyrophosphoryl-undecaprenol N-acetylglucosamine transferase [Herpetosiphonaceae bacterium]|nr:MAG: UDP-N-acetylglucosamine--N-acetylmuramyl-(pentapeptide) pyrophosphoryl-undecaprenol N-acetylglucosamine transferase [Herpetosiphonaceae bacterium]